MNFINFYSKRIALATIMVSLLIACAPSHSELLQNAPLRIEYTWWWGDYTILVAEELGLFEKYGVTVEPVYYENYSDSYSDLASNILDGGLFALDDAINTNDKTPLKAVAVYDDGGFYYLVGSKDVKNIPSLKGKRIGTDIGSFGEFLVLQALQQAGLTINDVTLVDVAAEEIPNYLGVTIDAGYTWEPYASQAVSNGASILYESGGTKTIIPDVIVFNTTTLENRPQDVQAFLKAWFEAVNFRSANPSEANQIIAKKTGLSLEEITVDSRIYTLQENIVLLSNQSSENIINLNTAFNANSDFLLNIGVLRSEPDINQFINSSFLFE